MAQRSVVRYRLEYGLVMFVSAVLRLLPMTAVRTCGAALGRIVSAVDGFHRRIAFANLSRAFPSRSPGDLRKVSRATFAHFGSFLLELIKFGTISDEEIAARFDIEGEEHLRQASEQGRGILFLTGHFGYWEMTGIVYGLRLGSLAVLARPLDNPYLHDLLERIRTRTGNRVIYRQGAVRRVIRELAANHAVAFLIDQHMQTDVVEVDFFNRPVATTSAFAALALRTGAVVIPTFGFPLPGGRYRFVFDRPVPPPEDGPDAIHVFTQRCTDVLEMYVRRDPQLWLWMHRRWRIPDPAPPVER